MARVTTENSATPVRGADADTPRPWWQRLLWFVALWALGVCCVGSVGIALHLLL